MAFKLRNDKPLFRARREAIASTMARMHAMTEPFLARNLLKLARDARSEAPEQLGNPAESGYDVLLVWQVIPILAKRVGGCSLLPNEGVNADLIMKTDQELREAIGVCMSNNTLDRLARTVRGEESAKPSALDILGNGFVNGNPIAMTADRLAPPPPEGAEQRDWLADHMREISKARFGDTRFSAWEPAFQDYEKTEPFRFDMAAAIEAATEETLAEMDARSERDDGPSRA